MPKLRTIPLVHVTFMAGMCLFCRPAVTSAVTTTSDQATRGSYASSIVQYVREDKVYLLEKIRGRLTKPSEKIIVEALLTEDAPQAARLYRKQLADHPDPSFDQISREKLAAYEKAAMTQPGLPVMAARGSSVSAPPVSAMAPLSLKPSGGRADSSRSVPSPAPVAVSNPPAKKGDSTSTAHTQPTPSATAPGAGSYTLQFGSFDSVTNAEQLKAQISASSPAQVRQINGIYKVRLARSFATRQEAMAFARTLPVESFVVSLQP